MTHRSQIRSVLVETKLSREEEQPSLAKKAMLRVSDEQLALMVEAAMVGFWDWDIQTGEMRFNERWAERTGYTLAELASVDIYDCLALVHPDNLPVVQKQLDELFTGVRPSYDLEFRIRHHDGHWIWIRDWGRVIEWGEDGKPLRMSGFHIDISARKLMEEAVRERAELFQALFADSHSVNLLIDPDTGGIIDANEAASVFYGYPKERLVSMHVSDINVLTGTEIREEMAKVGKRQGSAFQFRHLLASGEIRDVEEYFSSIQIAGRTVLHSIVRDITSRKRMEEELEQSREAAVAANLAKTKLLGTAAHEFRTPLSLLQSSLDILDRYGNQLDEEQRKTQGRHIRNATRQLTDLAESLLTYRNVEWEAGNKAEAIPCDIGVLSRTIAEEMQAAKATEHEFIAIIGEECGLLLIAPALYRRVLENLLVNAFHYTPTGRQVSLEVVKAGGRLRVTVADQGIGIEQGDLERIFDPFFRGSNVGQQRGIGLGLSIIRESLMRMEGEISVASTLGQGTRFEISLPWREVDDEEDKPLEDEPME